MSRPQLEVAEVFRRHGERFLNRWGHTVSPPQRQALHDIRLCRTAALGGHLEECDHCARRRIAYNSCRNRSCPKGQSPARDRCLAERAQELLPVAYGHVVFTVPQELAPLARQNPSCFYALLFRAMAETLRESAANSRHLGARIGFLAVLHTWSQNRLLHPHLHCLVPAGGLALDGSRWIACRRKFFLPVNVLSRLFRGKLLVFLEAAGAQGKLEFHGQLTALADPARFRALLHQLRQKEWVVYAKPPFGGPQHVLKYLARYTHRVALSNGRWVSLTDHQVSFQWRDSKEGKRRKVMTLDAVEFIRSFLLHVLPSGFVKIRHFGFLAHRNRAQALALCRQHVQSARSSSPSPEVLTEQQRQARERRCPGCQRRPLHVVAWLAVAQRSLGRYASLLVHPVDSS